MVSCCHLFAIRCQLAAIASSYRQSNTIYAGTYNNHERKCYYNIDTKNLQINETAPL
jgi:hypothetical protein